MPSDQPTLRNNKTWVVTITAANFVRAPKQFQQAGYVIPVALQLLFEGADEDTPKEAHLLTGPGWSIQSRGRCVYADTLTAFDKEPGVGSWLNRLGLPRSATGKDSPRWAGWWTNRAIELAMGGDGQIVPLRIIEPPEPPAAGGTVPAGPFDRQGAIEFCRWFLEFRGKVGWFYYFN